MTGDVLVCRRHLFDPGQGRYCELSRRQPLRGGVREVRFGGGGSLEERFGGGGSLGNCAWVIGASAIGRAAYRPICRMTSAGSFVTFADSALARSRRAGVIRDVKNTAGPTYPNSVRNRSRSVSPASSRPPR
jgi:hypothetical protein